MAKFRVALFSVLFLAGCASHPSGSEIVTCGSEIVTCGCGASGPGAGGTESDLVANVGDRVFYAFNKSMLTSDADATLGRQAAWLAKYPSVNVLIAGNADERGTETYNLALGKRRADASAAELEALGVAPTRIQTISYGKDCPVAPGNNEASYQQNRNAITSVQGFNPQTCH